MIQEVINTLEYHDGRLDEYKLSPSDAHAVLNEESYS